MEYEENASVDTQLVDQILKRVDEKAIVALASDLIEIPSFKPDETPVAEYLADFFNGRGYEIDLQGAGSISDYRYAQGVWRRQKPNAQRAHRHQLSVIELEA